MADSIAPHPVGPHPGFLLAEDAALKRRLSNITVTDNRNSERLAKVFFGYPTEESEKFYPFITIDMIDINFASERQHSEVEYYYSADPLLKERMKGRPDYIDYFPSELDEAGMDSTAASSAYVRMDQVVPVDILYQVTTYCRVPRHDIEMQAKMLRRVFPLRRGFIEIPEDGTIRRCDLVDWRASNLLDQEAGYKKRTFRKVYTVRINAEIPQSDLRRAEQVTDVNVGLEEK